MGKKAKVENPFVGIWRIVSMSGLDQQYLHEEVEPSIEVNDRNTGEFHFGCANGYMDCRLGTRDGEPAIEWTWDGNDEMDPAQGRGWAVLRGVELHGIIFFHQGDEFDFVAKKRGGKKAKR